MLGNVCKDRRLPEQFFFPREEVFLGEFPRDETGLEKNYYHPKNCICCILGIDTILVEMHQECIFIVSISHTKVVALDLSCV